MKRVLLIVTATAFITGCVYSERHTPYGYSSSYSTITPVYPRYEEHYYRAAPQPRYVVPVPVPVQPRFRAYEEHHEHRRHRHEHEDDDHHEHSRPHHRW